MAGRHGAMGPSGRSRAGTPPLRDGVGLQGDPSGRPFNCTAGLVALTTGGVFERHPNLRVAFFECSAEWILYWMHRMDDDYKRMKNGFTPKITKKPSEYLKQNCYVTCEADERMLRLALEEFNEDRVLLASDYPHFDSEYPGTVHELQERSDISDK